MSKHSVIKIRCYDCDAPLTTYSFKEKVGSQIRYYCSACRPLIPDDNGPT